MQYVLTRFRETHPTKFIIYIGLYFLMGVLMNELGKYAEIARFESWWQIITGYVLYMAPISILVSKYSFFNQYCYGLLAMGILEFIGYAFHTSYVYPNNILIQWFGPYTFALVMTLFFALYLPVGNALVDYIFRRISKEKKLPQ